MDNSNSPQEAIKSLEKEYESLIRKAEGLKTAIDFLKEQLHSKEATHKKIGLPNLGEIIKNNKHNGYTKDAPFKAKILYILKQENRFLHIKELAELLHTYEPDISIDDCRVKAGSAVSHLRKDGTITNIKEGNNFSNTFWGSKKWLNEAGVIIKGHEYDKKYLRESQNIEYEI